MMAKASPSLLMHMTRNIKSYGFRRKCFKGTFIVDACRWRLYKMVMEPQLFLSQPVDFKEASAPVKI
jgi:hypothetical protein